MSLDIAQVARQFQSLLPTLRQSARAREAQLALARQVLPGQSPDWGLLRGLTTEEPSRAFPLPRCPEDYGVLATDGSQIDIDRHAPATCYLINIGEVALSYGTRPGARLSSHPSPRLTERALSPETTTADDEVEDQDLVHVDLERSLAELQRLSEMLASADPALFTLGLLYGSLILWTAGAERYQPGTRRYVEDYVSQLKTIRLLARDKRLALASYISFPSSAEIANTLNLDRLLDRDLFGALLKSGERSAAFASRRRALELYEPEDRARFFYIQSGREVGRVEVPAWVAQDPERLDMAHAIIYDQCQRIFGYPVALMEAHQQAVVSEADRQTFWQLVSYNLEQEGLSVKESDKSRSKRVPWA